MTITIQLNSAEEARLLEPLLALFREHQVQFTVGAGNGKKRKKPSPKPTTGTAERLHGILKLPESFDYKAFVTEELLTKYGSRG